MPSTALVGAGRSATRRPMYVLLALAALLALVTACGGSSNSSGPRSTAGDVLPSNTDDPGPYTSVVHLPWGTVEIHAGKAEKHLTDNTLSSDKYGTTYDKIAPPKGGSWVPLAVVPKVDLGDGLLQGKLGSALPATSISVVDGSRTVALPTVPGSVPKLLAATPTIGYLALPWTPTDLHVRVTFDGVSQDVYLASKRVDQHGTAAQNAPAVAREVSVQCGKGTVPGYRIVVAVPGACMVFRVTTGPYAVGLGYAASGHHWLAVTALTTPPDEVAPLSAPPSTSYNTSRGSPSDWSASLAYGTSVAKSSIASGQLTVFVFDVAASDVGSSSPFTLTVRFSLLGAPRTTGTLVSTRTFSIPAGR